MKLNKFLIVFLLILIGVGVIIVFCKKEKICLSKVELIFNDVFVKIGDDDD